MNMLAYAIGILSGILSSVEVRTKLILSEIEEDEISDLKNALRPFLAMFLDNTRNYKD